MERRFRPDQLRAEIAGAQAPVVTVEGAGHATDRAASIALGLADRDPGAPVVLAVEHPVARKAVAATIAACDGKVPVTVAADQDSTIPSGISLVAPEQAYRVAGGASPSASLVIEQVGSGHLTETYLLALARAALAQSALRRLVLIADRLPDEVVGGFHAPLRLRTEPPTVEKHDADDLETALRTHLNGHRDVLIISRDPRRDVKRALSAGLERGYYVIWLPSDGGTAYEAMRRADGRQRIVVTDRTLAGLTGRDLRTGNGGWTLVLAAGWDAQPQLPINPGTPAFRPASGWRRAERLGLLADDPRATFVSYGRHDASGDVPRPQSDRMPPVDLVLRLLGLGLDPRTPLLREPVRHVDRAIEWLLGAGAVESVTPAAAGVDELARAAAGTVRLTELGRAVIQLPTRAQFGCTLAAAARNGVLHAAATVVAGFECDLRSRWWSPTRPPRDDLEAQLTLFSMGRNGVPPEERCRYELTAARREALIKAVADRLPVAAPAPQSKTARRLLLACLQGGWDVLVGSADGYATVDVRPRRVHLSPHSAVAGETLIAVPLTHGAYGGVPFTLADLLQADVPFARERNERVLQALRH